MTSRATNAVAAAVLRRGAQARLERRRRRPVRAVSVAQTQRLLHELQVHQVELEMQNVELQEARNRTELLLEKYTDLYDFAPVGYLSVDEQGLILEANLTAAGLLGVERSKIIGQRLQRFVAPANRSVVQGFLTNIFTGSAKQGCQAILRRRDESSFWADLQSAVAGSLRGERRWSRVAVSDITALKRAEDLQRHSEALAASNRELEQEILRRQAMEEALAASEQNQRCLLEQSHEMQEQLRHLSHQMLRAQEEERKRISRELHDQIAQTLLGISVHLENLARAPSVKPHELRRRVARTQRLVEESVKVVHRFARELRPALLDDLGLIPTLHSLIKDFTKRTGVRVQLTTFTGVERLSSAKRTVLYRVVQSALANVAQHAQASRVEVSLKKRADAVQLQVKDNGKSFHLDAGSRAGGHLRLGLLGMRERVEMVGGDFQVHPFPGRGTTIEAQIPCRNSGRH